MHPQPIPELTTEDALRLWSYIDVGLPNECWRWKGATTRGGYGRLQVGKGKVLAHRLAYVTRFGNIPASLYCLHRCDNPPCCNPAHLFLGDQDINMKDARAKGRFRVKTHCSHGHEFTESNTYLYATKQGYTARHCRTCRREEWHRRRAKGEDSTQVREECPTCHRPL